MYVLFNKNWKQFVVISYKKAHFENAIPYNYNDYVECYNHGREKDEEFGAGSLKFCFASTKVTL